MLDSHGPQEITLGKEQTSMFESILLLAFCLIVGLIAVAVCGYLVASGQFLTLDGLSLALICAAIGGFFVLMVVWSFYTGELKQILEHMRKKPTSSEPSDKSAGEASK
jgi:hypothetical protein